MPADRLLATVIRGLFKNDLNRVARPLVRLARVLRRSKPVHDEQRPTPNEAAPAGPFRLGDPEHACELLVYVPRSLESYLIDDATGGYGYSHVAVDCGEVDLATGKRVMIEATTGTVVHRSYLDKYGQREFIRIPLAATGLDCGPVRECVQAKLGEPYDYAEALTWGMVDDPAKQVCSDLAADCLPTQMRMDIVRQARAGRLGRHTVSVHGPARRPLHSFVSPNGFARYFGAPPGHKVEVPDQLVRPRLQVGGPGLPRLGWGWIACLAVVVGVWIGWQRLHPAPHETLPT